MSLDAWYAGHLKAGEGILRFYGWRPHCISIGYHQDISVIDRKKTLKAGIDVVRRPTGGRAIFHAEELTYSIVIARSVTGHRQLYDFVHQVLGRALRSLGYQVTLSVDGVPLPPLRHVATDFICFTRSARSEIQFNGRKVVGSAQKILPDSILQHGSVIIGPAHTGLSRFLQTTPEEKALIHAELQEKTITLSEIRPEAVTPERVMAAVVHQLESIENLSIYWQDVTAAEMKQVQECQEDSNYILA
jgi:lipoate-protein ligase A